MDQEVVVAHYSSQHAMQSIIDCDLAANQHSVFNQSADLWKYKTRVIDEPPCDSSMDTLKHFISEKVVRYFVDSNTFNLPMEMDSVHRHLVDRTIVQSIDAAKRAIDYLQEQLPSSIVIHRGNTSADILSYLNLDTLAQWLEGRRAIASQFYAVDDEESLDSWDSDTNNTIATNYDDFSGSSSSLTLSGKPLSTRELLANELFTASTIPTGVDSLCGDFDSLLLSPTALERQDILSAINNAAPDNYISICPHNNPGECNTMGRLECRNKVHLERVVSSTTDESLGDCNYLDTCFKGRGCHYVHYRVQLPANRTILTNTTPKFQNLPSPQWIQCNLQKIDLSKMGNDYGVIIADPPWDIHMSVVKNSGNALRDDDIANLAVQSLQTEGIIFLWVTGRALDAGRQCLKTWGYTHTEELVWLKINQLGRTIGTGRTGHWLNHTKEHVLVGVKGNPNLKKQLDVDTLVSASRGNSKKPEELYTIIERIAGNSVRKIELFGRENNLRPGWLTLGSELKGTQLNDPLLKFRWTRASK